MSLIEINTNPPDSHLKAFGRYLFPLFTMVLAFVMDKWGVGRTGIMIALSLGLLIMMIGWTNFKLIRHPMVGMMILTMPIALCVSFLALFLAYYVVITPTGFIMKLLGKDLLAVRIDKSADTYWVDHPGMPDPQRYFRQF